MFLVLACFICNGIFTLLSGCSCWLVWCSRSFHPYGSFWPCPCWCITGQFVSGTASGCCATIYSSSMVWSYSQCCSDRVHTGWGPSFKASADLPLAMPLHEVIPQEGVLVVDAASQDWCLFLFTGWRLWLPSGLACWSLARSPPWNWVFFISRDSGWPCLISC